MPVYSVALPGRSRAALALAALAAAGLACAGPFATPAPTAVPLPVPLLWRTSVSSSVISPPTVVDDRFFLVDTHSQVQGRDLETGAAVWTFALGNALQPESALAADAGLVFAVDLIDDPATPATDLERPRLVALNTADGTLAWETWLAQGYAPLTYQPVAAAGGRVYFEADDQPRSRILRAADSATGQPVWLLDLPDWLMAAPVPVGDMLYLAVYRPGAQPGEQVAGAWGVAAATGQVQWQVDLPAVIAPLLAVGGGQVFAGGLDGVLYALDAATGATVWTYAAGAPLTPPLLAKGALYVGTTGGRFAAIDAATGAERWAVDGAASVERRAAISGGLVFYGSSDGYLHAVEAASGAEQWRIQNPVSTSFESAPYIPGQNTEPVVAGDRLLYFNVETLAALSVP